MVELVERLLKMLTIRYKELKVRHKGSNTWSRFKKRGIFHSLLHLAFRECIKYGKRKSERGREKGRGK